MSNLRLDLDELKAESFMTYVETDLGIDALLVAGGETGPEDQFKSLLPTCEASCNTCAGSGC